MSLLASALTSPETVAAPKGVRSAPRRPIVDTHIHLYEVSRPGGVPWPSAQQQRLYRDVRPADYKAVAEPHGVIATGVVEASNVEEDNQWILRVTKGDRFFRCLVAYADIDDPEFPKKLEALAKDPRVVGVRAFLWSGTITLGERQLAHLRALADKGMTLDLISRGGTNPKDRVSALAAAVPHLRIVLDHLAGAKGEAPSPTWELELRRLADLHPNVHVKFSSFFDMYNPGPGEDAPWTAPTSLDAYKAHFDVLMTAFGEDRLIWGSNWPVSDLGGDFGTQIALAEAYLAPFGTRVRDKVMYKNALRVYRRAAARPVASSSRPTP
jgi:predicted TIM-barrel fold metal-dependent hydrolase